MRHQAAAMDDLLNADVVNEIPWQVEQLRCTAFLLPLFDVSVEPVFRTLAESDPLQVSENRQQAIETAGGSLDGFKLEVVKVPGRLDIILHSKEESIAPSGVAVLGSWIEIVSLFSSRVLGWLRSEPQLQRLALGAIVLDEVRDRMTGYKVLNELLPKIDIDVQHSSDFFYQINRPRLATFNGGPSLKINRLSKWSVAAVVTQRFTLSTQEPLQRPTNLVGSLQNYCRAELDLSTDAEIPELPAAHIEAIWEKFVDFAREILLKGDIP